MPIEILAMEEVFHFLQEKELNEYSTPKSCLLIEDQQRGVLSPHIPVRVDNMSFVGFLDSGSHISAVSRDAALWLNAVPLKKPIKLRSVTDDFSVTESVTAIITIGGTPIEQELLVLPDLPKEVLLGNDFLARAKLSLHSAENMCKMGDLEIPFLTKEKRPSHSKDTPSLGVHLLEHVQYIKDNYTLAFPEYKQPFHDLIDEFMEVFDDKPSVAKVTPMRIDTGDAKPVRQRVRPLNPGKMEVSKKYTQEQVLLGILVPSNSDWASNYVFVIKPDGSIRPCGDFRNLNAVTVFDAYPMPIVHDVLVRVAQAKVFSTFDLSKGFNQIPLDTRDAYKTAIFTPLGLMHFIVMPFGLKNAPAVFQRVMEEVLGDMMHECVIPYIDDCTIYSNTPEEHLVHLRRFLEKMRAANLKINPKKIQPMQETIKLLGHIVENGKFRPDPAKIAGIQNFPLPKSVKQLQSFLGSINYYRTFVKGLAAVAKPLYALTSPAAPKIVSWSSEHKDIFEQLKKMVVGLVLHLPDLNGQFTIQTDASGYGLGAVLLAHKEGQLLPCSYISRGLTGPEKNYSVTEQECLAVVWAIEKFRMFVECREFIVQTDHKALVWLMGLKDPKGRLARWAMKLQGFTFRIEHRPGSINYVPDALSRNPLPISPEEYEVLSVEMVSEIALNQFPIFEEFSRAQVIEAQESDNFVKKVVSFLKDEPFSPDVGVKEKARIIATSRDAFILEDGLIVKYHNPEGYPAFLDDLNYERIVAPSSLKDLILRRLHDDVTGGHLGVDATFDSVQRRFYWPGMYHDVQDYVSTCHICQTCRSSNSKPLGLMRSSELTLPWDKVSVDLIGPLPRSKDGNEQALVIIDTCSGWPEVFPLRGNAATAENCCKKVLSVFCRWGFPRKIVSDNGPQFASDLWTSVMALLKVKTVFVTPYHPQANPVERKNRDIKDYMRKYLSDQQKRWDLYIDPMLFALRSARNKSTGLTPAEVNLGKNLTAPIDVVLPGVGFNPETVKTTRDFAKRVSETLKRATHYLLENRELAGIEQKLYYDPMRKHGEFQVGDLVTLLAHPLSSRAKGVTAGLLPKREGPYIVLRKMSPLNYELGDINSKQPKTFAHVVQLKLYHQREGEAVMTDAVIPECIRAPDKVPIARGIGKKKGRPLGSKNSPTPVPSSPIRDGNPGDRITRSQTQVVQK